MSTTEPTVDEALDLLERLSPQDRLRVVSLILPRATNEVLEQPVARSTAPTVQKSQGTSGSMTPDAADRVRRIRALYGIWKDMGFTVTAEDIDEARREMWANFPRDDIV